MPSTWPHPAVSWGNPTKSISVQWKSWKPRHCLHTRWWCGCVLGSNRILSPQKLTLAIRPCFSNVVRVLYTVSKETVGILTRTRSNTSSADGWSSAFTTSRNICKRWWVTLIPCSPQTLLNRTIFLSLSFPTALTSELIHVTVSCQITCQNWSDEPDPFFTLLRSSACRCVISWILQSTHWNSWTPWNPVS